MAKQIEHTNRKVDESLQVKLIRLFVMMLNYKRIDVLRAAILGICNFIRHRLFLLEKKGFILKLDWINNNNKFAKVLQTEFRDSEAYRNAKFSFNFFNFYTQFNFVYIVLHDIFICSADSRFCTRFVRQQNYAMGDNDATLPISRWMDDERKSPKMQVTLRLPSYFHANANDLSSKCMTLVPRIHAHLRVTLE